MEEFRANTRNKSEDLSYSSLQKVTGPTITRCEWSIPIEPIQLPPLDYSAVTNTSTQEVVISNARIKPCPSIHTGVR